MATIQQLEIALVNADKAGDMDAARKLAAVLSRARQDQSNQIPDAQVNETLPRKPEPTLGEQIVGAGEAGLSAVTGATGGTIGMLGGFAKGLAEADGEGTQREQQLKLENAALEGANALTYQPRTQAGQDQAKALGEAMQGLIPLAPLAAESAMLGRAVTPAARAAGDVSAAAVAKIKEAAPAIAERVSRTLSRNPSTPTEGTKGSAGSAGTDMAVQRQQLASDLPVPIRLTKGQAERSFEQQRFEQETAKDASTGAPLRDRFSQQNEDILKNFDAWVDMTGAEAPSLRATGVAVDKALVAKSKRDKAEIRVAYQEAKKSGELADPIALDSVVQYLNDSAPDAATAPILNAARQWAVKLGIARDQDGQLVPVKAEAPQFGGLMNAPTPNPVTLERAETFRQAINRATDYEPTNIRQAAIIKGLIDQATESAGGNLYRRARRLREQYARQYEDRAVIAKLLNTKRGMADRQVAITDVWNHSIMKGSPDDVRHVRRVLQTGGEDGKQAWRELQGATVNWIREEATKGAPNDQRGNPIISAAKLNKAIRTLDHDGKLDFIFGKKGAQQLRDINDLAKVVYTSPPGSVNTSNTASVLLAALAEAGAWGGTTGLPVPVLTGLKQVAVYAKNRRIQKRVEDALNEAKREEAKTPTVRSTNRTLH